MSKCLYEFNDKDREGYELLRSKCDRAPIYYLDKGVRRWFIMPSGPEGYLYVYLSTKPFVQSNFISKVGWERMVSSSVLVQREEALPYAHRN